MSSQLWFPGAGSEEDLVNRIHRQIEGFAEQEGIDRAVVELEVMGGAQFTLDTISPEPGYGFMTIRPHPEQGKPPQALILPIGSVVRITLSSADEPHGRLGFSLPQA